MKSKRILLILLPLIISTSLIYLSLNEEIWKIFWDSLNIPYQIPPFSDLESISRALNENLMVITRIILILMIFLKNHIHTQAYGW